MCCTFPIKMEEELIQSERTKKLFHIMEGTTSVFSVLFFLYFFCLLIGHAVVASRMCVVYAIDDSGSNIHIRYTHAFATNGIGRKERATNV